MISLIVLWLLFGFLINEMMWGPTELNPAGYPPMWYTFAIPMYMVGVFLWPWAILDWVQYKKHEQTI